jgi:hypothetical protein
MKERKKTTGNGVDREEIQRLAYRLWEERGKKPGSPDDDWFRAEEILREAGSPESLPFSSVEVEPIEQ